MITPEYCKTLARYNAWQYEQLIPYLEALSEEDLTKDRGAFFGSIMATINHLLWGDQGRMSRFDGQAGPAVPPPENTRLHPDLISWRADRLRTDARILNWFDAITEEDLTSELEFHSAMTGKTLKAPRSLFVTHFFNHQTHHRGQIHAMVTATGSKAPTTDIIFMPEDV